MLQAQSVEGLVPVGQARAVQARAGRWREQPDARGGRAARQFAEQRQAAAIR